MAFTVYASLLPFELQRVPLDVAWEEFRATMTSAVPSRFSRTDVLANILLCVPVGFFLAGTLLVDRARRAGTLVAAAGFILSLNLALSLAVEFLQVFTSDRVSSKADVISQAIGATIGILAWAAAGPGLTSWVRHTLAAAPGDRLSRLLTGYAAAWVFVSLAPFDITLDLGDLAARVRDGRINLVPFGAPGTGAAAALWDGLAEVLAAAPLGVLGLTASSGRRRSPGGAIVFGLTVVMAIEAAQVFVRSHAADVTDVLLAGVGVAAGVWIGTRALGSSSWSRAEASPGRVSWAAVGLFGAWCAVLALYHWQPYEFVVDSEAIRRKIEEMSFLPFAGHRGGSDLNALKDLLVTIGLAAPLGAIGAFFDRRSQAAGPLVTMMFLAVVGCVLGLIEAGQLFLPTRIPDPTDVLVGFLAACGGLVMGRWVSSGRAPAGYPAEPRRAARF
jgi:VanZ family protein